MIGIQGETALDEVTKSPADAALSTTSTNSVQNKVITKLIGTTDISSIGDGTLSGGISKLNNDLTDITKIHVFETSVTASASGVVSLPSKLTGKKVLSVEVYGANSNGASAIGLGDLGCRLVTVNGSNELIALSNGSAGLRWTYID